MSAKSLAQRSKGDAFVQEADATLKKSTWLASSTKKKNGRAVESLTKAADAYKAGGCNDEAGKAYQRAAALHKDKLKNMSEASKCLSDAGECLKKSNPTESTRCYQSAVSLLCDAGKLDQANLRAAEAKKSPGRMSDEKKSATGVPTNSGVKKSVSKNKTGAEGNWTKPSSVGGGGKKKAKKKAGLLGSFVKK
ncbi:hypothetical protein ACHAW5_004461 [Stephanodiscus triporus]|uniref:Uncharacterized protein n=1 Tax=Stephanodiscus triporus TaxID=2934178 RepID=A0ABD3QAS8_9STRA